MTEECLDEHEGILELPESYDDSIEKLYDSHLARCLKYEAEAELQFRTVQSASEFSDALDRYLYRNKRLRELRSGATSQKPKQGTNNKNTNIIIVFIHCSPPFQYTYFLTF